MRDSPADAFDILGGLPSLPIPHVVTIMVVHLVMEFLANTLLDNSAHLATCFSVLFLIGEFFDGAPIHKVQGYLVYRSGVPLGQSLGC